MVATVLLAGTIIQSQSAPIPFGLVKKWWVVSKAPKWEDYKGKVVILHSYPSFCCGFDQSVRHVRQVLNKYPGKVAAVSVVYGTLAREEAQKEFVEATKGIKIDWPVGIDPDEDFCNRFYPGEMPRYTYTIFDRKGNRLTEVVPMIDQLSKFVEKVLAQP